MSIEINKEIVARIMSDIRYKTELAEFLNQVIDEELEKGENMDDQLVSECVDALVSLDEGNIDEAIEKLSKSSNIIRFCHKKSFARKNLNRSIAAAIALILLTTGVTFRANPAFADQAMDFFTEIISILKNLDKQTLDLASDVVDINIEYFGESTTVKSEKDIDTSKIKVMAIHQDGTETEVPVSDCIVTAMPARQGETQLLVIYVSYKGNTDSIPFTIEEAP